MSTIVGNVCNTKEMFLFIVKSERLAACWFPSEKENISIYKMFYNL